MRSGALLCAVLVFTVACRDRANRDNPTELNVPADAATPCAAAMRSFAAGDLATWTGLPPGCTDRDIGEVFSGGGDPPGDGRLSSKRTKRRSYSAGDPQQPIEGWFDDADTAFLITWEAPAVAGDVAVLLSALGPPEHKLAPGVGTHAASHQWIYASRGSTLWVFEPRSEITRVAVYRPTTPTDYEMRLGGRDKTRYWPRRR